MSDTILFSIRNEIRRINDNLEELVYILKKIQEDKKSERERLFKTGPR